MMKGYVAVSDLTSLLIFHTADSYTHICYLPLAQQSDLWINQRDGTPGIFNEIDYIKNAGSFERTGI